MKNNTTVTTTNYISGFHYENDALKFFATAEGYVNHTLSQGISFYNYIYNYTDHLGNIRLSYTNNGINAAIIEENHYYPFGLKHKKYGSVDKDLVCVNEDCYEIGIDVVPPQARKSYQYKVQNKEWQDELGLNVYDFHARHYMPDIVRTPTIDPKSEMFYSMSPYSFLNNSPLYFVDPTGMAPEDWWKNKKGEYVWFNDAPAPTVTIRGNNYEYVGTSMADVSQDFSERWNSSFSRMLFSATEGDPYPGEISQMSKSKEVGMKFEQWRQEDTNMPMLHIGVELTYGTVDNIHILATGAFGQARGISGETYSGDHATNRAMDGFITLASGGYAKYAKSSAEFLKSSPKLWNSFQTRFSTTNKGATRTEASKAYREFINNNNNSYFGNQIYTRFNTVETGIGRFSTVYDEYDK